LSLLHRSRSSVVHEVHHHGVVQKLRRCVHMALHESSSQRRWSKLVKFIVHELASSLSLSICPRSSFRWVCFMKFIVVHNGVVHVCMSQVYNDDEASSSSLSFMSFLHRCPWVSSLMKFIVMALFISSVVVHMALQESSSQLMKFIVVHDVHRCPWRSSFRWVCFTMTELMKFVVHELTSSLSMSSRRRSLCIWLCISRVYNDRAHEVHRLLVYSSFMSLLHLLHRCPWAHDGGGAYGLAWVE
jgi:hypothetical protein